MVYPHDHEDERESRFANERYHANIQNDGTFSVIPQMRGGVTDADQLIRLGEVAKKYHVPLVKVTGSQRVGLYGVKKEELPNIWEDLGMRSASAYGKKTRSVKSCVGKEFCRFGTQYTTRLGIRLEKHLNTSIHLINSKWVYQAAQEVVLNQVLKILVLSQLKMDSKSISVVMVVQKLKKLNF